MKNITAILIVLFAISMSIIAIPYRTHAVPTGTNFDNVIFVAMENQNYADVLGTGTGTTTAPFISSLLPKGSTIPNYNGYGAPGRTFSGCSAACYAALASGATYGISDGGWAPAAGHLTILDRFTSVGLTFGAYCESGCPRGNDHFPWTAFNSAYPNMFAGSTVSTTDFVTAANSANPPNFLWFTPTDNNNMHNNVNDNVPSCNPSLTDCSIPNGDAYIKKFFVGATGTLANPATGSLLASNLFSAGHRTLLVLWWDEYAIAPILFYGTPSKQGFISTGTNYDHYSTLRLLEDNWGLASLTSNDDAAIGLSSDILTSAGGSLSASFAFDPQVPQPGSVTSFTGTASGGNNPYTFAWNWGDSGPGTQGIGAFPTHIYNTTGTFTVSLTATDSATPHHHSVTVSRSLTVANGANFGTCSALPTGWNCGNALGAAGTVATINSGNVHTDLFSGGIGDSNNFQYATTQKGSFPFAPVSGCTSADAPRPGILPSGISTVYTNFTFTNFIPQGTYRYHIYIALYFWLPNGAVTAGGHTHQCLDTQSRVENINGVFSSVGTTTTYDAGDSFGWSIVPLGSITVGKTYILTANVTQQCNGVLTAWGIPLSTPCTLSGIEIGTEGFQFNDLTVDFTKYAFMTPFTLTIQRPPSNFNYGYSTFELPSSSTTETVTLSITPVVTTAQYVPMVTFTDATYTKNFAVTANSVLAPTIKVWVCGSTGGPATYTITSSDNAKFPTRTLTVYITGTQGSCPT